MYFLALFLGKKKCLEVITTQWQLQYLASDCYLYAISHQKESECLRKNGSFPLWDRNFYKSQKYLGAQDKPGQIIVESHRSQPEWGPSGQNNWHKLSIKEK